MISNFFKKPVQKPMKDFEVLSLSGGGIFGLYSARIVQRIEEHFGDNIAKRIDLLAGTSIGGIIALGLSREIPAEKIIEGFYEYSPLIFKDRDKGENGGLSGIGRFTKGMTRARYDSKNLALAINNILGEDLILADAMHPVMITAYDLTAGTLRIFSCPVKTYNGISDDDVSMLDVALATSAVPAAFSIHQIEGHRFVDGAVYANSPDLVVLKESVFKMDVPIENLKILSVGTMIGRFFLEDKVRNDSGFISWGLNNRLPNLMVSAQQQFTTNLMKDLLSDKYLRVDAVSSVLGRKIDPTTIKRQDLDHICNVADNSWNNIKNSEFIKRFGK